MCLQVEYLPSIGPECQGVVALQTAPLRGSFSPQKALENGLFAALSAGL